MTEKETKDKLINSFFGGGFHSQGQGFFPALELLSVIRGCWLKGGSDALLPVDCNDPLDYVRTPHDFARRLFDFSGRYFDEKDLESFAGSDEEKQRTRRVVSEVLGAVRAPTNDVSRRRKSGDSINIWFALPLAGELIHDDAVARPLKPEKAKAQFENDPNAPLIGMASSQPQLLSLERSSFRGAGLLAHKILRTDPDEDRLRATREGLATLVEDGRSPIGQLGAILGRHDRLPPQKSFRDMNEHGTAPSSDAPKWQGFLREGVHNIVTRSQLPEARRAVLLMHWVPYCLARYQLEVVDHSVSEASPHHYLDFGTGPSTVRSRSQFTVDRIGPRIRAAMITHASPQTADVENLALAQADDARKFLMGTLGRIGALNSPFGTGRHFTLRPTMLEALVFASIPAHLPGVPLTEFCSRTLWRDYDLVVDRASAAQAAADGQIDLESFHRNSSNFASLLEAQGLLERYSDSTSLVSTEMIINRSY
ncbi:MAG: hypothetical protein WCJ63_04815 [Actinomycetes bacterium]